MDDWEAEEIPQLLSKERPKSSWEDEDEDVDETDVKDSWEDEDEPAAEKLATQATKKPATKGREKKGKNITIEVKEEEPLDPVAEKLRRQRLVEEADYKSTKELFGGDEKTLDDFIPKSESDFQGYAELMSRKLLPYQKSNHYVGLLKAVVRLSMVSMNAASTNEIASSIRAITNEKLKLEKEANNGAGKKKTGGKAKKQLRVDKPGYDMDPKYTYDARDEYDDFM